MRQSRDVTSDRLPPCPLVAVCLGNGRTVVPAVGRQICFAASLVCLICLFVCLFVSFFFISFYKTRSFSSLLSFFLLLPLLFCSLCVFVFVFLPRCLFFFLAFFLSISVLCYFLASLFPSFCLFVLFVFTQL